MPRHTKYDLSDKIQLVIPPEIKKALIRKAGADWQEKGRDILAISLGCYPAEE